MTDFAATFRKPFAQQLAAFRLRLGDLVPTARWDDITKSEHDTGFMVAGAMKADLLADLGAAVDRAIVDGTGLEAFRADFREIVDRRGWHGWTGEGTKGGEAWRTKVIYRTNMATSYSAGRFAQLVEGKYDYWVYRHGGSREPRLQHLGWDGLILPADHPFWTTHFPPNGWGCSCRVFGAHSIAGAVRLGGKPSLKLPDNWQAPDPKTGVPAGISKGWDYAPGASVAAIVNTMAEKLNKWPYDIAKAFTEFLPEDTKDLLATSYRNLPSSAEAVVAFAASVPSSGSLEQAVQMRTLGLLTRRQIDEVERLTGLDTVGFDFALDPSGVRHILNRHSNAKTELSRGQRVVTLADFAKLLTLLNDPDSVVAAEMSRDGLHMLRYEKQIGGERFIALFAVRNGRRRLVLVTIWIERNAGAVSHSTA